jgi:hypothetical protein
MWVPPEVPKLIHEQHLRDAQNRMLYRQFRAAARDRRRSSSEARTSPRRALGLGLVRLGLWVLAS